MNRVTRPVRVLLGSLCLAFSLSACTVVGDRPKDPAKALSGSTERHLANIRQLTFGRQNAEAYFSFDGNKLILQSTNDWTKDSFASTLRPADTGLGCYQMFVMDLDGSQARLVS
ncbi:MAG: hypothetical protein HP494_10535, partial [Nitrospira sp.]|nr:hypothetical protein [Nitrospira sp.]